ncbi:MAG: hypothetical protein JW740_00785 [Candidatus Zambryskibacteria bacterium]|nr:hypothetical protein [Candidatus Zambryskibacteria bacterium]
MKNLLDVDKIFKDFEPLRKKLEIAEENDSDSCFFLFVQGPKRLHVETTASNMFETITHMPVEFQAMLIFRLAQFVPEPGDTAVIVKDEDNRKKRRTMITRLKPAEDGTIRLLITR